jgi:Zn-dependent protease
MAWSFRLGRFFGIPVNVHVTFLLLLAVLAFGDLVRGGVGAAVAGTVWLLLVFGSVLLHEFGHALAARRFGIETRDVTLLPIGGLARLERMPATPRHELWIALAGPAVNLAIAALVAIWLVLTGQSVGAPLGGTLLSGLLAVNVGLLAFNMLPAFPMDGGRVLRALLGERLGQLRATEIAATVGRGMAVVFGLLGLIANPLLVLIAFFVWFGAGAELQAARARHAAAVSPVEILRHDPWGTDPHGAGPVWVRIDRRPGRRESW